MRGIFDRLRGNNDENKKKEEDEDEDGDDKEPAKMVETKDVETVEKTVTEVVASEVSAPAEASTPKTPPEKRTLQEEAEALRAAAARTRLEAERMDAELTLSKIASLEKQLKAASANSTATNDLKNQLSDLQRRLGLLDKENADPATVSNAALAAGTSTTGTPPPPPQPAVTADKSITTAWTRDSSSTSVKPPLSETEIQERVEQFDAKSEFYKVGMARSAGFDANTPDDLENVNRTELILRLYQLEDIAGRPPDEDEGERQETFGSIASLFTKLMPDKLKEDFFGSKDVNETEVIDSFLEIKQTEDAFRQSQGYEADTSNVIQAMFAPRVWRRGGDDQSLAKAPTMEEAQELVQQLSSRNLFCRPIGTKPRPVSGGFLLGGTNTFDNGTALMKAIDEAQIPLLQDRLSLSLLVDPAVAFQENVDVDRSPLVLFVMAKDATTTPPRRVVNTVTSMLGVVATWIACVGPFLNNPVLMTRAEDQLKLFDSGMEGDLSWLTELAVPLFVTYMVIQACHELAHRLVATYYKMDITIPTFIPSPLTGLTTSVTSLKSSPPNRQALLEFGLAGPLAGILASMTALVVGLQWTAVGGEAVDSLPVVSFELLRQSTLASATVNSVLGAGTLDVPAMDAASRSLTLHLHPVAVAGFLGLFTHALSLLPVGCTDGGRVSTALFGRGFQALISTICMIAIFLVGFFGSDLFLFYGIFVAFFQGEVDLPTQDDTDGIPLGRTALALASAVLVMICVIPVT